MPSQSRLEEWYHRLFRKAEAEGVIEKYKNVDAGDFETAKDFPYFEGDFWPYYFEDIIKRIKVKVGLGTVTEPAAKVWCPLSIQYYYLR